jgi:tetratricopeptide (TPR) repeat protein
MKPQLAITAPRLLSSEQQATKDELIEAGNDAFDAEAYQAAFECYHKASLIDSGDPEVWNALGMTYANLDYPREAWRSYRLALQADPENLNALWYSAEFLYNLEDFYRCHMILERYLQLEDEPDQRQEAEELLSEVSHLIGDEPPVAAVDGDDDAEEAEGDVLPEGFEEDEAPARAPASEDEEDDDDLLAEEDEDLAQSEYFQANIRLRLNDLENRCRECGTTLPTDAPYCYACHAPCFYDETAAAES